MRAADALASLVPSQWAERVVFGIILVLCAVGNLPWQLDNYDQAKQAYVSYEIAHQGNWAYQHTPRGDSATKPPLAGWISLPIYALTQSWDLAWRLPGYAATLVLLWLLAREGRRILPEGGALLAGAAFALNLLTPRIATLVRTDMLLTLWITICGWMIHRKISTGIPWSPAERWGFFAAMLAAFFTKGPILYAFVLPGMVAFWFLAPREKRALLWAGWWPWVVPLVLFFAWLGLGIATNRELYEDVVVKEFFSRFDQSLKSHERAQPLWFYFPHLIHKFAPWSVLLIALPIFSHNVRRRLREDPGTLWLACWALGGLLCMTLVPSKRVDRIFPVVPPLALLFVSMVAACQCGRRVRAWCGAAVIVALCMSVGYFLTVIGIGYADGYDALVRFGHKARALAAEAGIDHIAVVASRDEGLVMYCDGGEFLHQDRALRLWNDRAIDALVIPESRLDGTSTLPPPALDSGPISRQGEARYLFYLREKERP